MSIATAVEANASRNGRRAHRQSSPRSDQDEPSINEGFDTVQRVVSIPLAKLHRHSDNRVITPESVADLVQSLRDHGQREPIRVRPLKDPIGHFEILSGERRFVAAQQVDRPPIESMLAIVEQHSDSQSLIELAVANAARQDLDPIERAELLTKLITPLAEGGAGMDRYVAGRLFGLNSESGVKNALRLLKLPKWMRDKLSAGEVTVGRVRPLCAYPNAILEPYGKWLEKTTWAMRQFTGREAIEDDDDDDCGMDQYLYRETRPMDKLGTYDHGWQNGGQQPCLFDVEKLTDKQRAELCIVEVPNSVPAWQRKKGQKAPATRLVALNAKAWHKLQDPLVKAAVAAAKQPKSPKSKSDDDKPLTAAELKAKRKKANDQLENCTREWMCLALRYQCSQIKSWTQDEVKVQDLVPWLIAVSHEASQMARWNEWALVECGADLKSSRGGGLLNVSAVGFHKLIATTGNGNFYAALWRVLLWPAGNASIFHPDLAAPGSIPERLPQFGTKSIHQLAEACGVSMETVWMAAAKESMQRSLVRQWLTRHNKEQLVDLAKSLGVTLADGRRSDMVDELLGHHQHSPKKKPLKLPPMITKLAIKGGAR